MTGTLPMTDQEADRLAWIHSNKFTIPDLFWKKFLADKSFQYACRVLKVYSGPEKGFLHVEKPHFLLNSFYTLNRGAIRALEGRGLLLARSPHGVRINTHEREHDIKVQGIRVAFEANSDLSNVFWVSDFEMRSGVTPGVKAQFLEGTLDVERWRSSWSPWRNRDRRTPDGYFQADLGGQRCEFVLEMENTPNPDWKIQTMVAYLEMVYPEAFKLVVSANRKNAIRMYQILRQKIRFHEQKSWFVSYMDRALTLPFKKVFQKLDRPIVTAESHPPVVSE